MLRLGSVVWEMTGTGEGQARRWSWLVAPVWGGGLLRRVMGVTWPIWWVYGCDDCGL
jgi:hypothetical protein